MIISTNELLNALPLDRAIKRDELQMVIDNLKGKYTYEQALNSHQFFVHQDAVKHGLFDAQKKYDHPAQERAAAVDRIMEEVNEAYDAVYNEESFGEELADIILITESLSYELGYKIGAFVEEKRRKNIKRPYRHEGENVVQE